MNTIVGALEALLGVIPALIMGFLGLLGALFGL